MNKEYVIAVDLGATKLETALSDSQGNLEQIKKRLLGNRQGAEIATLMAQEINILLESNKERQINAIGICVPGIANQTDGTVWAPNIGGWDYFPLVQTLQTLLPGELPIQIDSDRACSILAESWLGAAKGARDALFLAVGSGIGLGILANGTVLRGFGDIAGATGWMSLCQTHQPGYESFGCFEYHASGDGLARVAKEKLLSQEYDTSLLKNIEPEKLRAEDVFAAYEKGDTMAAAVIHEAIAFWGQAIANYISLFNPQFIILGGGVFGPAIQFLPQIIAECKRWAQPISMTQVKIMPSALEKKAILLGASRMAFLTKQSKENKK
jgi:glucokinase